MVRSSQRTHKRSNKRPSKRNRSMATVKVGIRRLHESDDHIKVFGAGAIVQQDSP